jgi:23S rRNA (cytidine1920-2'-O)/16S rRNA (cytidine1409-2'-O)-methyltransferase
MGKTPVHSQGTVGFKQRLDCLLVSRGLASTREEATRFILAGLIKVNGQLIDKRGKLVEGHAEIHLEASTPNYVSRAGEKLASGLDAFKVSCQGMVAMDVGASTGGFTDCLLQRGVSRVYAIDVGYGQLDWKLRNNPQVIIHERCNIRYLPLEAIPDPIELAVIDVSFISLRLVLPCVLKFLAETAIVVALLKPQFEVGKGKVGRKGVVRQEDQRAEVKQNLLNFGESLGLHSLGVIDSPVLGRKGNKEMLLGFYREKSNNIPC